MNILFIAPYVPYPPISGGRLQTFLRLKHLKMKGHAVFLQTLALLSDQRHINKLTCYIDDIETIFVRTDWSKLRYILKRSLLYEIFTDQRDTREKLRLFAKCKKDALAVFVPIKAREELNLSVSSTDEYNGIMYAVSGVNIINGAIIRNEGKIDTGAIITEEILPLDNLKQLRFLLLTNLKPTRIHWNSRGGLGLGSAICSQTPTCRSHS